MSKLTLVLNSSYQPLGGINETDAICLITTGKAKALKSDEKRVYRSKYLEIPAPIVVILNHYVKMTGFRFKVEAVTNSRLFARDDYTCLYCGKSKHEMPTLKLTRDHIFPKSRGGTNEWTNIATACGKCNRRKDNRTPEESGMLLLKKPTIPVSWTIRGKSKLTKDQLEFVENLMNLKE